MKLQTISRQDWARILSKKSAEELLELLTHSGIRFVVIGGTAMRLYNSPRVMDDDIRFLKQLLSL